MGKKSYLLKLFFGFSQTYPVIKLKTICLFLMKSSYLISYVTRRGKAASKIITHGKHRKPILTGRNSSHRLTPLSTPLLPQTAISLNYHQSLKSESQYHRFHQLDNLVFAAGMLYWIEKCFCSFVYPL